MGSAQPLPTALGIKPQRGLPWRPTIRLFPPRRVRWAWPRLGAVIAIRVALVGSRTVWSACESRRASLLSTASAVRVAGPRLITAPSASRFVSSLLVSAWTALVFGWPARRLRRTAPHHGPVGCRNLSAASQNCSVGRVLRLSQKRRRSQRLSNTFQFGRFYRCNSFHGSCPFSTRLQVHPHQTA